MTTLTDVDTDFAALLESLFADYPALADDRRIELDRAFWTQLDELGLVALTRAEADGGSGAGWPEAVALIGAAVRSGARLPFAEHDLLAGWLCATIGFESGSAVRTAALLDGDGRARAVPWLGAADRAVVIWRDGGGFRGADVAVDDLAITPGANAIGEPRDDVVVDLTQFRGIEVAPDVVSTLANKSALIRAVAVCAALEHILALSIDQVGTREQFGRPLAKFQAVQAHLADIAAETALARAATDAALSAALDTDWTAADLGFRVAVARSCVGHAASAVVRAAHQVHGAIGTTREHRLHRSTRAALAWRSEYGSVRQWDDRVTAAALDVGGAGLWRLISG